MCSICRNPKCIYQFNKEKWGPPIDDMVIIQLPETDETLLETIRKYEAGMLQDIANHLRVPLKALTDGKSKDSNH